MREHTVAEVGRDEADETFDEGMEHWWKGDRASACRLFRGALRHDPLHCDAHNHIAIDLMDRGRLTDAAEHLRLALKGGARHLEREGDKVEWGWLENRPYLRSLGNHALLLRRRKRYREALAIHETMLTFNPNDNQGVRHLIGEEHHRIGELDAAIVAYESNLDNPDCCFGLALVLLQARRAPLEVGVALLGGFAMNRYVAPMLLGERWQLLDGWHATNMAEPEWASDYVEAQGDLWRKVKQSAVLLRRWWSAPPVAEWRLRLDELMVALKSQDLDKRRRLVSAQQELTDHDQLLKLARQVLG